jgi:type I restriction enzyme M protein
MSEIKARLPKWLEIRHSLLWNAFKDKSFGLEEATKVLKEKNKDKEDEVPVFISELKKAGWLSTELDPKDARKRIYKLKSKETIISEHLSLGKNSLSRTEIERILKRAADLIRTRVDYKFILILLFYKRISDKWEAEYEKAFKEAIKDGLSEKEARQEAKSAAFHDFDIPEEFLWENIRKEVEKQPEKFSKALKTLAERNPELKDILDNADFIQFTTSRENAEILRQLVELFSEKKLHHVSPDILGDAYEWILKYFAPTKAKEGEIYTPREVIKLMIEILDPQPKQSVYDPACGSGGMLIEAYKHVENAKGKKEADKIFLFGQEANQKTMALGKMNMYVHDIRNTNLISGDTLLYPKFKEKEGLKKFDIVIANPPWNQDGYDETVLKKSEFWKQRFRFGFVPKQSADWAWIQHMLFSAKENSGKVGVIIDNGALFRSGKEKAIRAKVLEEDLIESVLLLPEKLFYNTGAPGAILFLNKNKPSERKGKVLFINASQKFEKHPEVRKLNRLSDENIAEITKAFNDFKEIKGFCRPVSLQEIKENDYNLNVTLYVYPEEETEDIDVNKEWQEYLELKKEDEKIDEKIEGYLKEIR